MNKPTPVEWLVDELKKYAIHKPTALADWNVLNELSEQVKEIEKKREYETKAFWFGRGIHAGREDKIDELKPVKP